LTALALPSGAVRLTMYSAAASDTTNAHCPLADSATAQVPSTIGYSRVGGGKDGAVPDDDDDGTAPPAPPVLLDDGVLGGETATLSSPTFHTVK
jgi:hypothetical protein